VDPRKLILVIADGRHDEVADFIEYEPTDDGGYVSQKYVVSVPLTPWLTLGIQAAIFDTADNSKVCQFAIMAISTRLGGGEQFSVIEGVRAIKLLKQD
jgi:hypothetical protein